MIARGFSRLGSLLCLCVGLAGCAVAPRHAAYDEVPLPPLLPVRAFVANTDFTDAFTLSPDGGFDFYQLGSWAF